MQHLAANLPEIYTKTNNQQGKVSLGLYNTIRTTNCRSRSLDSDATVQADCTLTTTTTTTSADHPACVLVPALSITAERPCSPRSEYPPSSVRQVAS